MRTPASACLLASALLAAGLGGCFGPDVVDSGPSLLPSTGLPVAANQAPLAAILIENETGVPTRSHWLGDNLTLLGNASHDPDGRILRHTWKVYRSGVAADSGAEHDGPTVRLRPAEPGDYVLVLYVDDDRGATAYALGQFSVHRRVVHEGLFLLQPPLPAVLQEVNLTLASREGILALSLNATFPAEDGARLRLELRAHNGTVLNRTEGTVSPLFAVAVPVPGHVGNYSAHAWLVSGTTSQVRLEFVAWHGYNI